MSRAVQIISRPSGFGEPTMRSSSSWFSLLVLCWLPAMWAQQAKFDGPKPPGMNFDPSKVVFENQEKNGMLSPPDADKTINTNERFGIFLPPSLPGANFPGGRWHPAGMAIELTPDTRLSIRPNEAVRLTFEVINYRDIPQGMVLTATDTAGLIRYVNPPSVLVAPRGSSRVSVELFPTSENAEGLLNTVTLAGQVRDGNFVSRGAMIRVSKETEDDGWDPTCSFSVPGGQCRETTYNKDSCVAAGWNVEATIRDDLSGLLRIESSPPGALVLPPKFIAGTRAPVTVQLASSCCQDKITLRVWDANGNSRSCEVYVHGLLAGEIAAIVLGCILLIALIAIIVLAVLLCRRKRAHRLTRRELPTRH